MLAVICAVTALAYGRSTFAQLPPSTDIVWHNGGTGETQIWRLSGHTVSSRSTVVQEDGSAIAVGTPWRLVGTTDLNADSKPDMVWHNGSTGHTQIWLMDGSKISGRLTVVGEDGKDATVGNPWRIAAIGDFSGDRKPDLLWHNGNTGESQVWQLTGFRVTSRVSVVGETGSPALVGTPWSIVTANDMNGDGSADVIWHNGSTGEAQVWHMNANKVGSRANVVSENGADARVGSPWRIAGSKDFNRDGRSDLLWHNGTTGETQIWHMNGFRIISRATVLGETGRVTSVTLPWRIIGGLPTAAAPAAADKKVAVPARPPDPLNAVADVFISQVYGGGGSAGPASETNYDYVEIFNRSDAPVDVTGWAVQYASAAGTTWQLTPLKGSIGPMGYYLVVMDRPATINIAPDATGTISMAAAAGKVVLTQNATSLTEACPTGIVVVDRIAYGTNGSPSGCGDEWGGRTGNLGKDTAAHRNNEGCVNTGSTSADFSLLPPTPRNGLSTPKSCAEAQPGVEVSSLTLAGEKTR